MRANEIFENKNIADVPSGSRETMMPSMVVPDLDGYYELYRMLIALASYPNIVPMSSVVRDLPYIAPYSKQEYEETEKMLKKMGKHPNHLTKFPSEEPKDTNKISPVRPYKDFD